MNSAIVAYPTKKYLLVLFLLLGFGHLSMAQDPGRYQQEVERITKNNEGLEPGENLLVFTGSSSIKGWKDITSYFPDHQILNHGFGGSQTSDLIHYVDELILNYKPKKVFVYEGDNDISAGKSTETILKDFQKLVKLIKDKAPETEILLISAKPSISRWHLKDKYLDLNNALNQFSQSEKNLHYVDIWTPMLDNSGKPKPGIFLQDKLHMNKAGYDLWAEVIGRYLD